MINWDNIWIKLMDFGDRIGCHQIAERSFFINNYQFPVCARCTGVIFGEIIAIILILLKIELNIFLAIILLLVMGFDWFIQYINWVESNNIRRLLTGTLGGIGLTFIYYHIFVFVFCSLLVLCGNLSGISVV